MSHQSEQQLERTLIEQLGRLGFSVVVLKDSDAMVANLTYFKKIIVDDIFANPIFEKIVGNKLEIDKLFNREFSEVIDNLEKAIKV